MGQSSDRPPLPTRLLLTSETLPGKSRRAFKLLDIEKLREVETTSLLPLLLMSVTEVDSCGTIAWKYLHNIIGSAVPWAKPYVETKPL